MCAKRTILFTCTILWMTAIFFFSAKPADESADMSLSVGRVIGKVFVSDYEEWTEEDRQIFAERIDHPVRKTAHAAEYAVLGILLAALLGSLGVTGIRRLAGTWVLGTLYGASDEFHQLFVPGRSGQLTDVMIDSAGVAAGVLLTLLAAALAHRSRGKRS